ncbi:MAG: twin-arginine translocation signal domain-containing protein, partial [Chloroflexi bacterium]|nr:twin-arginine translocation signal domain-containing protein [Chloroflexota bacterium]
MSDTALNQPANCGLTRRDFLKLSSIAGGAAAFLGAVPQVQRALADEAQPPAYGLADPANQIN